MNCKTLVRGERSAVFGATIVMAVVFVFSLVMSFPEAAAAGDTTLSVGDTNADTFAENEGDGAGDTEKKVKKGKKGKKGKKNGKKGKKNGKKGKKGKKNNKAEKSEDAE